MKESLGQIGFDHSMIEVNEELVEEAYWFDEALLGSTMSDFFYKRPVEYAKGKAVDVDDLF